MNTWKKCNRFGGKQIQEDENTEWPVSVKNLGVEVKQRMLMEAAQAWEDERGHWQQTEKQKG